MAAERVALLDDIEPPPYENTPSNVQDRTSVTQDFGENHSGQPAGSIPQCQFEYPPQSQHGYAPQGQPFYPIQQQQPMPGAVTTQNVMVMQSGCTTVVPAVYPDDNHTYAWFVCLCCFWPLGIAAIINSNRARDAINRGDYVSAMIHAKESRKFSYWAIGVHFLSLVIGIPLVFIYVILAAINTTTTSNSYSP